MEYKQMELSNFMKLEEPPILLKEGQTVWIVNKADITEAAAINETWACKSGERGYRLKIKDGLWDVTYNSELEERTFTEYECAKKKANEYMAGHLGIIPAKRIKPVRTEAFSYKRFPASPEKEMLAFCSDMGNGMYYIKGFVEYAHICSGESARTKFMNTPEIRKGVAEPVKNYTPVFKNMYRIMEHSEWEYAEAGYAYAVG